MKKALAIITNILLIVICILYIVSIFQYESHYLNGIFGLRNLTLNQDVTIYSNDSSISLSKGTMISSDTILEQGVLFSEEYDGIRYREYIPLDYFVEGEELKAEVNEAIADIQTQEKDERKGFIIKSLCCSGIYLVIAVPATIILIKKKKHLASVLLNIILVMSVLFVCSFIR